MQVLQLDSLGGYVDRLRGDPEEVRALFRDLLINVTSFFRDVEAWAYLCEELLPALLARREGQPIRVGSAGCASGEEAYTVAMVLAEAMGIEEFRDRVKIYATDVDEEALSQARTAAWRSAPVAAVPSGGDPRPRGRGRSRSR